MLGLDKLTCTVTDKVTGAVTTETQTVTLAGYALPATATTVAGSQGIETFVATSGVLTASDDITGAAGSANTPILSGGGRFNPEAPRTLAGIQTVTATEGQAAVATGGSKAVAGTGTSRVVHMRDGMNVTLNIASTASAASNTNPGGITIYGGADSSVIDLGHGSDTVVLGSASVTANANAIAGSDLVQATAAQAGALVTGTIKAATTLQITTPGIATGPTTAPASRRSLTVMAAR